MAVFTDSLDHVGDPGVLSRLGARISGWLARLMEAQSRSDVVARLENCSDAELARMGVARSAIIRHVYRDVYYL